MNLISNDCSSGYIYRDILKEQYQNPFIWTLIYPDNFLIFLKNYRKLNYKNIKLKPIENKKLFPNRFLIKIDDLVDVNFIHIIENKNLLENKKEGVNINTPDKSFIKDLYFKRLDRFLKKIYEKPIIIFHIEKIYLKNFNKEVFEILDFLKKYKIKTIIFSDHEKNIFKTYLNETIKYVYLSKNWFNEIGTIKKEEIKKILNEYK